MFPNLKAEMKRSDITIKDMAETLGKNKDVIGRKLRCPNLLKYPEAVEIRDTFFPNIDMDYLFAMDAKMKKSS